jgi:methyltransferase family protein
VSGFKDHFSNRAADYARFRPRYPAALFDFLAKTAPARRLAWDCATGNGQVAQGLAVHFERVFASDASAEQIRQAPHLPNVEFRVETAEASSLSDASVDLVTVAQALHWLDLPRFYAELRRVACPGALVAVWCYSLLSCGPEIDEVVHHYYREVVGPYWPAERSVVERGYRDLPFPFDPVSAPALALEAELDLPEFVGYLGTWSSAERYRKALGREPTDAIATALAGAWGSPALKRRIQWPLHFRMGRT